MSRSRFRKIYPSIWHNPKFRNVSGEAQFLFLYLLTSPHSTPWGAYILDDLYAMADTGISRQKLESAMAELVAGGLIMRCEQTRLVCIPGWFKHNIPTNKDALFACLNGLAALPKSKTLMEYCSKSQWVREKVSLMGDRYSALIGRTELCPSEDRAMSELCKASDLAHETEQEKETEKEKKTLICGPSYDRAMTELCPEPEQEPEKPKSPARELAGQIQAIIDHLNKATGSKFRTTDETRKMVKARMKSGATLEDFFAVIDHKVSQWGNDQRMSTFLRPSTLFRPSHFFEYLAEACKQSSCDDRVEKLRQAIGLLRASGDDTSEFDAFCAENGISKEEVWAWYGNN